MIVHQAGSTKNQPFNPVLKQTKTRLYPARSPSQFPKQLVGSTNVLKHCPSFINMLLQTINSYLVNLIYQKLIQKGLWRKRVTIITFCRFDFLYMLTYNLLDLAIAPNQYFYDLLLQTCDKIKQVFIDSFCNFLLLGKFRDLNISSRFL